MFINTWHHFISCYINFYFYFFVNETLLTTLSIWLIQCRGTNHRLCLFILFLSLKDFPCSMFDIPLTRGNKDDYLGDGDDYVNSQDNAIELKTSLWREEGPPFQQFGLLLVAEHPWLTEVQIIFIFCKNLCSVTEITSLGLALGQKKQF